VSHAGHNTVCESLAHGLPLVVAPIRDDQPIVAQQVVDAGAGIRVKFGRVRAPELRSAVTALLDDETYRAAAQRIRASFAAAGGAAAAADRLEKLT
jgi:UDP:flavonoid glycosyltransferase YjiC (YdhE family)